MVLVPSCVIHSPSFGMGQLSVLDEIDTESEEGVWVLVDWLGYLAKRGTPTRRNKLATPPGQEYRLPNALITFRYHPMPLPNRKLIPCQWVMVTGMQLIIITQGVILDRAASPDENFSERANPSVTLALAYPRKRVIAAGANNVVCLATPCWTLWLGLPSSKLVATAGRN
ncbi:hypothetical protein BDR04DRAFT_1115016 [Suillus decipiens]|nr:hypothetical protein BDR04DRAFT_1115016 [Suillus decipiens]